MTKNIDTTTIVDNTDSSDTEELIDTTVVTGDADDIQSFDEDLMLTTKDNPFNPHHDYTQWLYKDQELGYNTQSYLARVYESKLEGDTTDYIPSLIEETIQEIKRINPLEISYELIDINGNRKEL